MDKRLITQTALVFAEDDVRQPSKHGITTGDKAIGGYDVKSSLKNETAYQRLITNDLGQLLQGKTTLLVSDKSNQAALPSRQNGSVVSRERTVLPLNKNDVTTAETRIGLSSNSAPKESRVSKPNATTRAVSTVIKAQRVKQAVSNNLDSPTEIGALASRFAGQAIRSKIDQQLAKLGAKVISHLLPIAAPLVLVIILMMVALTGGLDVKSNRLATLDENAGIIADFLLDKGVPPLQVAAILGNLYAESSWNFGAIEADPGRAGYIPEGIGVYQLTSSGRKNGYLNYCASIGVEWPDPYAQLNYLWAEMTGRGTAIGYAYQRGLPWDYAHFLTIADLDEATKYFCDYFLSPDTRYSHYETVRLPQAELCLSYLLDSRYHDMPATDDQLRVVYQAKQHDLFGCTSGQCLKWAATCYARAGLPTFSCSCAFEAAVRWGTYTDINQIIPGAMVFASYGFVAGVWCRTCNHDAGHVAIYIGDGMVAENRAGVYRQTRLTDWVAIYGFSGWGIYR